MLNGRENLFGTLVTIRDLLILMFVLGSMVGVAIAKEIEVFEGQRVQIPDDVPEYSSWRVEFPILMDGH